MLRTIHLVFVGSIFSSAFLLFLVQPLVTRMLLPSYGGSPAVWNTALVFFQTVLLCGYLYAHLLTTRVPAKARLPLHGFVLAVPLLLLPPAASTVASASTAAWPAISVIGLLAVLVGAPFFALSTNAPLVQHWWSRSGFEGGEDPYWLYGASNLGSLLALLAYPFVLEPALGVSRQADLWAGAYVVFVALTVVVMLRGTVGRPAEIQRDHERPPPADAAGPTTSRASNRSSPVSAHRTALWVARSAIGSSLLLSVTMQITTDLAPVPLLWVVPLALYLMTFILAFSFTDRLKRQFVGAATVVAVSAAMGVLMAPGRYAFQLLLLITLATLFFGALLCHHDLAADRPDAEQLTRFYLWISFGGAVGGILNTLVAPLVFDSVAELPLTLMALSLVLYVRPGPDGGWTPFRLSWRTGVLAALALAGPLLPALRTVELGNARELGIAVVFGLVWAVALARYVGLFAVSVWIACALTLAGLAQSPFAVAQERSFFGVIRIQRGTGSLDMVHGNTVHGRQLDDPETRLLPITYYHPDGPLGSLVDGLEGDGRVGLVGLGTGSLAVLAESEQDVVFYEIDPVVERLARDHFTFLAESPARVEVVLGDGRKMLEGEPDASFDLLIVDAFSSDFVPIHLLTSEAVDLFLRKVRRDGILAFHVSNRHADLRRVLRGYAESRGRALLFADYSPSGEAAALGAVRTVAAVLAPDDAVLVRLAEDPLWTRYNVDVPSVRWTDDHADLLSVLR
jgi:hypothetical protein